jgi:hypothetical protein
MLRHVVAVALALGSLVTLAPAAHAASGVVRGRILHYENQGGFCPCAPQPDGTCLDAPGRSCVGARYRQSQFNTYRPVIRTRVRVVKADGTVIGTGSTNTTNGTFVVSWSDPASSVTAQIQWYAEDRDGRFAVRTWGGGQLVFWGPMVALTNGTTSASPQNLGDYAWGSPSSPHAYTNVYAGAQQMWWWAMDFSSLMQARFTNVEVRGFADVSWCQTSCWENDSGEKQVYLDTQAAFAPQARITHELGHAASDFASKHGRFDRGSDYDYAGLGPGWSLNTPEWGAAMFEEGLATALGDMSWYAHDAWQPHTCLVSQAPCMLNQFDLELSPGPASTCNLTMTQSERWPLNAARYVWDTYDSRVDGGDNVYRDVAGVIDALNQFPHGRANGEDEEPWCCALFCWICDKDGRSSVDYRTNFQARHGDNTFNAWNQNCSTVHVE